MKIPGLTDLAADVKRIADALTKLAEVAGELVEQQATAAAEREPATWFPIDTERKE